MEESGFEGIKILNKQTRRCYRGTRDSDPSPPGKCWNCPTRAQRLLVCLWLIKGELCRCRVSSTKTQRLGSCPPVLTFPIKNTCAIIFVIEEFRVKCCTFIQENISCSLINQYLIRFVDPRWTCFVD